MTDTMKNVTEDRVEAILARIGKLDIEDKLEVLSFLESSKSTKCVDEEIYYNVQIDYATSVRD